MNRKRNAAVVAGGCAIGLLMMGCSAGTDSQCDSTGRACTWIGQPGRTAFNKDGHDRLATSLYWTMDTLFAHDGTTWFIDWNNHLVRKVGLDGKVTSVVGTTDPVFPGDGDMVDPKAEFTAEGAPGTAVQLNHPTDLYELANGTILIMAWHNHKLRALDPNTGRVRVLAGAGAGFAGDGGPATAALFKQPSRLALDEAQNIYILDQQNERIRRIDAATNIITTIAGSGAQGFAGDGGPALQAKFNWEVGDNPEPSGGLVYRAGKLYIADTDNHRIRMLDLASGMITTIAGTGDKGDAGDGGAATSAQLFRPHDLEFGPDGDLYIADTYNNRVRAINLTTGVIRTVVGTGSMGLDSTDDKMATDTMLYRPFGIDFDPEGNLYVDDSLNSRVLRVAL